MSEFPNYSHPEFDNRMQATEGWPHALAANYDASLKFFRGNIATQLDETRLTTSLQWMLFRFGTEKVHPDSADGCAELLVMQKMADIWTPGGIIERPAVRLLYSESYEMSGAFDYFTEDVIVDHLGRSQYLVGSCLNSGGAEVLGCPVPLAFVKDNILNVTPNFDLFVHMPNLFDGSQEQTLMPFGNFSNPADMQHSLDRAIQLFGLTTGRKPSVFGHAFKYETFTAK